MALEFTTSYLADSLSLFRYYKRLGEGAMAQVSDADLLWAPDEEANSIALIVKHLAGNMRSRWTDFLTTDGEKPDRRRDSEFEAPPASREALLQLWESGWDCLFAALTPLEESQLGARVRIRGEAHSVLQAINRQLCHYAYHVGQMVTIARERRGRDWQSLSVPRGASAEYQRKVAAGEASQR